MESTFYLRDEAGNVLSELLWVHDPDVPPPPPGLRVGKWFRMGDDFYLGRRPLVRLDTDGENRRYTTLITDHLDSVRAEVVSAGTNHRFDFWPYGACAYRPSAPLDPHQFTAHEREYTGTVANDSPLEDLDSMHARYYSSKLGRFVSVDPVGGSVGSSQSWNRYSYVRNSPPTFVDVDGQDVTYSTEKLRKFYESRAERNWRVRATLDAYGPGSGRNLRITEGNPGNREATGTQLMGNFHGWFTWTATSEEQVAAWEAAGKGEAGTKAADAVYEASYTVVDATITLSPEASDHNKLHELGHADHAVRDPRGYQKAANEANKMLDEDYRKSESENIANAYAKKVLKKELEPPGR